MQSTIRMRLIKDGLMSDKSDYCTNFCDYSYVNEEAERLSRVLSLGKVDHSQYGIDHMITLYENRIINKYPHLYEDFKNIFDDLNKIRGEKSTLLFNMFNECLDMTFNGASVEMFEDTFMKSNFNKYDEIMRKKHLKLLVALRRSGIN